MSQERLPASLRDEDQQGDAVRLLRSYYGVAEEDGFEGRFFDTWHVHDVDPHRFCAEDVIATSFLSVHVPPSAARAVLAPGDDNPYNELLREIPTGVDFWDAGPPHRKSPQWRLENLLMALHGIGPTTASKLMARKRPRLVPINDFVVRQDLGFQGAFWQPLYELFREAALRDRLAHIARAARADGVLLPRDVSALRLFDVIVWMSATRGQVALTPQIGDHRDPGLVDT